MSIAICADSACDIPENYRKTFDIHLIPLTVNIQGEKYLDRVELSMEDFYEMVRDEHAAPSTSPAKNGQYINLFSDLLKNYDQVLHIGINSKGSESFEIAQLAADTVDSSRISCFDSRAYSLGYGLLVLEAARLAKKNERLEKIIQRLTMFRGRIRHLFTVENLDYLLRGNRIGKAQHLVGKLLNRKPILTLREGEIVSIGTEGSQSAAFKKIVAIMKKEIHTDLSISTMAIAHANNPEGGEELKNLVQGEFNPKNILYGTVGPIVGSHGGPGVTGTFYLADPEFAEEYR
jgi:DegV family protein with EDD domain